MYNLLRIISSRSGGTESSNPPVALVLPVKPLPDNRRLCYFRISNVCILIYRQWNGRLPYPRFILSMNANDQIISFHGFEFHPLFTIVHIFLSPIYLKKTFNYSNSRLWRKRSFLSLAAAWQLSESDRVIEWSVGGSRAGFLELDFRHSIADYWAAAHPSRFHLVPILGHTFTLSASVCLASRLLQKDRDSSWAILRGTQAGALWRAHSVFGRPKVLYSRVSFSVT